MNWMCPDDVKLTPVKYVVEISVFPYFLSGTSNNNSSNNNNDNNNDDEIWEWSSQ